MLQQRRTEARVYYCFFCDEQDVCVQIVLSIVKTRYTSRTELLIAHVRHMMTHTDVVC